MCYRKPHFRFYHILCQLWITILSLFTGQLKVSKAEMFATHQDGYQLGSLSYLPRIKKRRSEKPVGLTVQAFTERSLRMY